MGVDDDVFLFFHPLNILHIFPHIFSGDFLCSFHFQIEINSGSRNSLAHQKKIDIVRQKENKKKIC